ncbi:MAG: quinolinate synthase NadA [bacterium]
MTDQTLLIDQINRYKKEKNAVLLAHNYQRAEVQAIADYLGDSLELAQLSRSLPHDTIVFCGVHFMAESAALLAPDKTVLLPVIDAGCPLADCATPQMVKEMRKKHPNAVFIAYINTSAAVKAESDVVCTSANAFTIIKHFSDRPICYLPDKNLAAYASHQLGIDIIPWPGQCLVHDKLITADHLIKLKKKYPEALVMAHPEAPLNVLEYADVIIGTGGMIKLAKSSERMSFIVVTENGLVHRLRNENPGKTFIEIHQAVCAQMKMTTLESIHEALKFDRYKITVPDTVAAGALRALEKMLELTP